MYIYMYNIIVATSSSFYIHSPFSLTQCNLSWPDRRRIIEHHEAIIDYTEALKLNPKNRAALFCQAHAIFGFMEALLCACMLKLLRTERGMAPKSHLNVIFAFAHTSLTKCTLFKSHGGGTKYVTIVMGGTEFQTCMLNECGYILSYIDMHVHMLREASMNMSDSMPDFGSLPDFEISRFRTRQIPDKSQTNPRQIP